MSLTVLACLMIAAMGCFIFLYLTGKMAELDEKDRRIRRWVEEHTPDSHDGHQNVYTAGAPRMSRPAVQGADSGVAEAYVGQLKAAANSNPDRMADHVRRVANS